MNRDLQAVMHNVGATIDERYKALYTDLDTHIRSWSHPNSSSIKQVQAIVAGELRDFLLQRQQDIDDVVAELKKQMDDELQAGLSIQNLEVSLQAAGGLPQDLLQRILKDSPGTTQIQNRLKHIKSFLLTAYFQEALRDWDDIKRAILQRDFYRDRAGEGFSTLKKMDSVAETYLERAIDARVLDPNIQSLTPICYFDKNGSINSAPYTNMPLIGVPITVTEVIDDASAIAHELGHYAYNHASPEIRKRIDSEVAKYDQPYNAKAGYEEHKVSNWDEEATADVVTELLAGTRGKQQFREYLLARAPLSQEAFEYDDKVHPPTLIRPHLLQDSEEWNRVLDELGIDKDALSEAKGQYQRLTQFIHQQFAAVETPDEERPNLSEIAEHDENYLYSNSPRAIHRLTSVVEFEAELLAWNKDLIDIIIHA